MPENFTKVIFRIEQGSDGYPPINVESLWAEPLGNNKYRIKNTPFYAYDLSFDDIVEALPEKDGLLEYVKHIEKSAHNTIRVLLLKPESKSKVTAEIEKHGCSWEGSNIPNLIALDIIPNANIKEIMSFLKRGIQNKEWECEESTNR